MKQAKAALRDFALGYPGAREDFPWGERVIKVGKKVFVFLGMADGDELGLSVKLPESGPMALLLPFAKPTGYGLGKSGWVSARFVASDDSAARHVREWIDEPLPGRRAQEARREAAAGITAERLSHCSSSSAPKR